MAASGMSSVQFSSRMDADSFSLCMGINKVQIKMETLANRKKTLPENEVRFLLLGFRLLLVVSSHVLKISLLTLVTSGKSRAILSMD
jgi:hypothetical protein